MAIPPGSLQRLYDISDPACYSGSGNTVVNTAQAAYNLQRVNGPTFVSDGQKSHFVFNRASQQYLGLGNNSTSIGGPYSTMTINVWFQSTDTSISTLFSFGYNSPSGVQPTIFLNDASAGYASASFNYGVGITFTTTPYINDTWNMITMVSDGTNNKIYLNGVLQSSAAQGGGTWPANGGSYIGALGDASGNAWSTAPFFNGKVAYLAQYDAALSAGDILTIFNNTKGRFLPTPIAEYDFQNGSYPGSGTTVFDLSGTGNTLAISSGGTWVSGTPNYFDLNGNTAIYKSPAIGGIAGTDVYTLNSWYYLPTSVNNSIVFGVGSDGPNVQAHFGSGFSLGTLYGTGGFGLGVLELTGAAQPGWNFISYVATGSGTTAYLNGASVGSTTNNPILGSNTGICIGTALNSSNPAQPSLALCAVGRIGYASVYNVALGPGDISTIYDDTNGSYLPPPAPAPTVEYDFQNGSYSGSGSTIIDLQGGDTNLTVGNGHWVSGAPNYFDLQGDTNLFNTSPGGSFSSTTFTVNCWYNPLYTNPGTYASVWGLGKDGNPTSPILSTNSDGTLNIQWSFGYGLVGTTVTNGWHLISFVSNGSTTTLYVDGISIGSAASSSGTVASPYTIRLGSSSNSSNAPTSYAYGKIGYWSYFDVALDAAEVLDLYNATSGSYAPAPPPSSNGVGGRQFAQGFNG